jgi:hypothetical protein
VPGWYSGKDVKILGGLCHEESLILKNIVKIYFFDPAQ